MAIKMKTITQMALSGSVRSHARTDITSRDVTATIDEPEARGGTNQGLTPTETLISALIGCTNVITQRIAEHAGVKIGEMKIDAAASFDRRGVSLSEEVAVPFPQITLDIELTTDATPDQLEQIKRDLGRFCPIAKVIRGAGTELIENWTARPL